MRAVSALTETPGRLGDDVEQAVALFLREILDRHEPARVGVRVELLDLLLVYVGQVAQLAQDALPSSAGICPGTTPTRCTLPS